MLFLTIGFCLFLGITAYKLIKSEKQQPIVLMQSHGAPKDLKAIQYAEYFAKAKKAINADEVGEALTYSKRPRLTAAICSLESGGKKTAFNKKTKAKGLFQVKERYWS